MQYKCETCYDTGSRDQIGTYLDCNECGVAQTRRDLNDFVKSLGPTHPEDVALAIHQRALAMAPKQAARKPTDISQRLREYAGNNGYSHNDYADTMRAAADEIERYYGGMLNWKKTAEAKDAAPAAANGTLTDDQINTIWESLPGLKIVSGRPIDHWNSLLRHEFARAILAAAGPDAALEFALSQLIESCDQLGMVSADLESARAALSGAKGN